MIYFGIDPGPRECCGVLFDGESVIEVVNMETRQLVDWILVQREVSNLHIACEWIESFGMAVGRETFETVAQIGIIVGALPELRLIPRRDVKLNICKSPRAKDGNVRQAIIDRFGPVGTKKDPGPCYGVSKHAWAALAVAITACDQERTNNEATFHLERAC